MVCLAGIKRANDHVRLFDNEFVLGQTFGGHQISKFRHLLLELLGCRRCEEVEETEDLGVGLRKVLDYWKGNKLSEVDHINSLHGENNASTRIVLSASKRVSSLIELEAGEHDVEGRA